MLFQDQKDIIGISYNIFALEGPEHLDDKVAKEFNIDRSELHSKLGVQEEIVEQLLTHHLSIIDNFLEDAGKCKTWDPDFINLVVDYKIPILFNKQLKSHSSDPAFNLAYNRISQFVRNRVLDLWQRYTDLGSHIELSMELFEVIRDVFHSRVTEENLNYEFLKNLSVEFKSLIERLIKLEQQMIQGN